MHICTQISKHMRTKTFGSMRADQHVRPRFMSVTGDVEYAAEVFHLCARTLCYVKLIVGKWKMRTSMLIEAQSIFDGFQTVMRKFPLVVPICS